MKFNVLYLGKQKVNEKNMTCRENSESFII